uniref:Sodium/potassium-transporting ATPase subunit beta-1-interacting protein n=1 Tax=Callorhinchus milii TaxID=7868 RepID=A0A4W3J2C6_CALMI
LDCCSDKCNLLFICSHQLVLILERSIFSFLNLKWACILSNNLQMVSVLLYIFGLIQIEERYCRGEKIWKILWTLIWNVFLLVFNFERKGYQKPKDSIMTFSLAMHRS